MCQGAVPLSLGRTIVLGLRRLDAVREIDKASNVIVVEAGLTLTAAHDAAGSVDRRIPLHLGSEGSAQIGGWHQPMLEEPVLFVTVLFVT